MLFGCERSAPLFPTSDEVPKPAPQQEEPNEAAVTGVESTRETHMVEAKIRGFFLALANGNRTHLHALLSSTASVVNPQADNSRRLAREELEVFIPPSSDENRGPSVAPQAVEIVDVDWRDGRIRVAALVRRPENARGVWVFRLSDEDNDLQIVEIVLPKHQ